MTSAKRRVLEFPNDHAIGYLYKVDCFGEIQRHEYGINVGEAKGTVEIEVEDGWMLQLILTTTQIKCLKTLPPDCLESLAVLYSMPALDEDALSSFGHIETLRELFIESNRISDKGLDHLKQLSRLEVLTILSSKIGNGALARIAKYFPNLRQLCLAGADIDDKQLLHLAELPLEFLHLGGTKVTDAGLQFIGNIHSLKNLTLYQTHISGLGLKNLQALKNLQVLVLSETGRSGTVAW